MLQPVGRFKASRAGGYHVRTGCITCKKRHTKCDEAKPSCLNCSSTGRACDGYAAKKRVPLPGSSEARTNTTSTILLTRGPDVGFQGTDTERQCFEFFYTSISWKAAKILNLKNSHQFVLQAAYDDKAVSSAIVGLGYLGLRHKFDTKKIPWSANNKRVDDYAHRQYCRTLKHLQALISATPSRPIELIVITCYLLVLFEFFRGEFKAAMVHIRSGVNILRPEYRPLQSAISLQKEMLRVFSVEDTAASHPSQPGESYRYLRGFTTLEEAATSLDFWVARMQYYRQSAGLYQDIAAPQRTPSSVPLPEEDGCLKFGPGGCSTPLNVVCENISTGTIEGLTHGTALTRINSITRHVILNATLKPIKPSCYASWEPYFREIVSIVASLMHPINGNIIPLQDVVAAHNLQEARHSGNVIIPEAIMYPLIITAVECRNEEIRRQAVSLLVHLPWNQGLYNSARVAATFHETGVGLLFNDYCNDHSLSFD